MTSVNVHILFINNSINHEQLIIRSSMSSAANFDVSEIIWKVLDPDNNAFQVKRDKHL